MVDIPDVVTHTNFGDHRLRVFWVAGGQISPSPIDFHRRPYNTLALPCERVMRMNSCLRRLQGQLPAARRRLTMCRQQRTARLSVNTAVDDSEELGPLTDLYEDAYDDRLPSDALNDTLITVPTITGTDYENDEEFKYLFKYLTTGELSEDDKINKTTLLMSDQYRLEDDVLYRIEVPRKII